MVNSEDPDDIDEEEEISEDDISQTCPVSHKEAMAMYEKCLIWQRHQPEAMVGNTSTLVTRTCTRTCCGKVRDNS